MVEIPFTGRVWNPNNSCLVLTIPKAIRVRLGLQKGDMVSVSLLKIEFFRKEVIE